MVPNHGSDTLAGVGARNDDLGIAAEERGLTLFLRILQRLDSRAYRATGRAPFQFVRWLAALTTVIIDWLQLGTPRSPAACVPVLAVVTLLLLPDAQSIAVAGLRFDRLRDEMASQQRTVARLSAEVWSISNSLSNSSHVNITFKATRTARR